MQKSHIWTEREVSFIRENYKDMSYMDMSIKLAISPSLIQRKCNELGLLRAKLGGVTKVWSESEIEYLKEHFPYETARDIADHLKISDCTVRNKARQMGLKKSKDYDPAKYRWRYVKDYKYRHAV